MFHLCIVERENLLSIVRLVLLPTTNFFSCSCHTPHLYCKLLSEVFVHRKWRSPKYKIWTIYPTSHRKLVINKTSLFLLLLQTISIHFNSFWNSNIVFSSFSNFPLHSALWVWDTCWFVTALNNAMLKLRTVYLLNSIHWKRWQPCQNYFF